MKNAMNLMNEIIITEIEMGGNMKKKYFKFNRSTVNEFFFKCLYAN